MKRAFLINLAIHAPFFAIALCLPSCQSQAEADKLARIGDIALTVAERSGKITPAEAAMAREAGKLVLSQEPETVLESPEPGK